MSRAIFYGLHQIWFSKIEFLLFFRQKKNVVRCQNWSEFDIDRWVNSDFGWRIQIKFRILFFCFFRVLLKRDGSLSKCNQLLNSLMTIDYLMSKSNLVDLFERYYICTEPVRKMVFCTFEWVALKPLYEIVKKSCWW